VVIADLTSTAFCDSSGVRYLLLAHDKAAAHGAQLRLAVQPDGMVLRMLTLMGLHRVLQVHVSLEEATAA
jgi:anti-anti-sigma factor